MDHFVSDGLRIAYEVQGRGTPIVLVHGFAANLHVNWRLTGWIEALTGAGRQVIGLDCRGHGASDKPHDPELYGADHMPADVLRLMDHLGVERSDLMGYSMGGSISMYLLVHHADRFSSAVLAGIGAGAIQGTPLNRGAIADALSDPDGASASSEVARAFRAFAEQMGNDLRALAAIMRSRRPQVTARELAGVTLPVLIVTGEKDDLVGDPAALRDAIPGSRAVLVRDRDHLTAVPDPDYKAAVLEFLDQHSPC